MEVGPAAMRSSPSCSRAVRRCAIQQARVDPWHPVTLGNASHWKKFTAFKNFTAHKNLPREGTACKKFAGREYWVIEEVGVPELESGTSSLSATRSNQLSYTPGE